MESRQNNDQEAPNIGNIHTDFEKEEFYKWFENRGLLSEMRAYMRQLMVKAIEESNKNGKMSSTRKSATSPKLQAINLLLVDYLFHEDYLYTVSVFASEAQILESLPQYSRYVTETLQQDRWEPSCVPRFSRQETEDILDTLRLPPSHRDMQQTVTLYREGQESLLTCVVRTLASSHSFSPVSCVKDTDSPLPLNPSHNNHNSHQLWSQEMQNLLLMAGIKLQHIQRMQHKWQLIIEDAVQKARERCEEDQQAQRVELVMSLREELEEELRVEQSKVEQRESELNNLADQLSEVHEDITRRLAELQEQSDVLQERGTQQQKDRQLLDERFGDIQRREGNLELAEASLSKGLEEVANYQMAASQLQREVATSDASVQVSESVAVPGPQVRPAPVPGPQVASTHTQTLDTVDHQQQTSSASEPDPQLLLQLQTEREKINELQEENLELRAHALQQRHRIDELTNRAANLSTQLEESQVALTLVSARQSDPPTLMPPSLPPLPPSPSVFIAPTFGFSNPQRLGAGEESLFTPRAQQAAAQPDSRRRPSRFVFSSNPNPTSEESSPTDEVVQNARVRIQQLEAESAAVQRNYQAFQTRLFNSDAVMFPPLDATRTADHLVRMRQHDIIRQTPTRFQPFSVNSYAERTRNYHSPEEEDSSSDQTLLNRAHRIEHTSISNARRLFTQRNIRQFERWKQFKKKFQKHHDVDLHNRRNNTSSEDEEENFMLSRRRYVTNKAKDTKKNHTPIIEEQSNCNVTNFIKNKNASTSTQQVMRKENDPFQNVPKLAEVEKYSNAKEKSVTTLEKQSKEDKLRLEVEQSMKLIDSVKMLLDDKNVMNPIECRTLSNGSLAVESLPRDSDDNAHHELVLTENTSVATVRKFDPVVQRKIEADNLGTESVLKANMLKDLDNIIRSQEQNSNRDRLYVAAHNQQDSKIDRLEHSENDAVNRSLSLNAPTARVTPLNTNIASEQLLETETPLADVVEQGSEERGTSVTSASDILRELNPSGGSSSSVVSAGDGFVNDSHSSDFWN